MDWCNLSSIFQHRPVTVLLHHSNFETLLSGSTKETFWRWVTAPAPSRSGML